MRIRPACGLLVLVMILSGTAGAASKSNREERAEYMLGGPRGVLGIDAQGQFNIGAVRFPGGPEKWVSVRIENIGGPVAAEIGQNLDGNPGPELSYDFCGETEKPVKILPRYPVTVYLYTGTCGTTPSVVTSGEVIASFIRSK